MSRYFNWPTSLKRLVRFSAARAEDVNDALDDLSAGMDTLDADVDRAIKLPVGAGNQVLNLAPGVRANKVLAFDASGNVSVSVNDVDSSAASASAAATSATNAANSATAASTSATNAASSASSASTSATNASKLNLGAKASAPTLDNQGQALQAGASYFDTTMAKWRVWSGSIWINGYPGAIVQSVNGQTGNVALGKFDLTPIAAATFSYTNNLVTGMSEDGVTTTIAYNAQNQVSTVTYQRGANTLVETYTYSSGKVVSMSSTGSLGTGAGGGGGGGGGSGGPAAWGAITGTLADQTDLVLALAAKANTSALAAVATAGTYASLTGKPTLGTAAASNVGDFAAASHSHAASAISDSTATGRALLTAVDAAAARAVLGTTQSAWGNISGTISAQTDLSAALAGKLSAASNLSDLQNAATARTNLGLGTAAQSAASSFATATQGGKADTALQPGAGLAAIDSAASTKLAGIAAGAQVNTVTSVAGKTGAVTIVAGDVSGLGALATKSAVAVGDVTATGTPSGTTYLRGDGSWSVPPAGGGGGSSAWGAISGTLSDQTDLQTALNAKANTAALAAVATAGTYASLTGKPTLGTAAASSVGDFATAAQGVKADSAVQPAGLAPYAKTADLPPVPTALSQLTNDTGFVSDISGKVDKVIGKGLSTEDYTTAEKTKLAGIAAGANNYTHPAGDGNLHVPATGTGNNGKVLKAGATAGSMSWGTLAKADVGLGNVDNTSDANKPISTAAQTALNAKQATLVSGTNIKTVNGQSLLGAGDLVIPGGGGGGASAWADITGKPWLLTSDGWQAAVLPGRGGTLSAIGMLADGASLYDGTITHPALSTASLRQSQPRFTLTSAATAGANFEHAGPHLLMTRGDAAGIGGFTYRVVFSVSNNHSSQRGFFGIRGSTTSWGGTGFPPNGVALCIGVGFDAATHTNYQIAHSAHSNNSGSYINTSIPRGDASAVLELILKCPPNGNEIAWSLKDYNSGASASGTIASNIPNKDVYYSHRLRMDNNGAAAAVSADFYGVWYSNYRG